MKPPSIRAAVTLCMLSAMQAIPAVRAEDSKLDPVEVREPPGRGFKSSPYCFDPSQVRRYFSDGDDMIVQMSRREGNRQLRLTLSSNCDDALRSTSLRFTPGLGLDRVCGNVGDAIVIENRTDGPAFATRMPRSRIATGACRIEAVGPVDAATANDAQPAGEGDGSKPQR